MEITGSKYAAEIAFWKNEIAFYQRWYNGKVKELYGIPCPTDDERITRFDTEERNAIETWVNADKWRYCKHLWVEPTYFSGHRVLEIGPGPLGLSRFFSGAEVLAVDPLVEVYQLAGYEVFNQGIEYWRRFSEDLSCFKDEHFGAAFSVNAIDHVDDFEKTISEIERVTFSGGEIRIEFHYHEKTVTEPNVLNDEIVEGAFKKFDMKKIVESPSSLFYPVGTHPSTDRFAVWSNKDYLYPAVRVLK